MCPKLSDEDKDKINDYNWLYNEYVVKKRRCSDIAKDFKISEETVRWYIKKNNIPSQWLNFIKSHDGCSPMTEDHRTKIAEANRLKAQNPEFRAKLSESVKQSWKDEEIRKHHIESIIVVRSTPEYRKHQSDMMKEKWLDANFKQSRCGENASNWKGGLSYEPYCPKFNEEFKNRVRAFFDNKCIICGMTSKENGQNLSVHHVEYNKQACCDGNPIYFAALCCKCHGKTNFNRIRWEEILHTLIDNIYDGKSYYTKDEYNKICSKSYKIFGRNQT